tara:strand:- start:1211 stop:1414 length:204 start_codon:yes stop_codon:yes gene_type:complete
MVAFCSSGGSLPISANSSKVKNVLVKAMRDSLSKNSDGIDKLSFEDIALPEMAQNHEWQQDKFSFLY